MTTAAESANLPRLRPPLLIIDDTPANLMVLGSLLAEEFDLRVATSGAEGLALAAQWQPVLILLDVMMPQMDGFEVCRRLKADALLKHIPVIFVTAATDVADEAAGLALGAIDYITKPVQIETARQRIHNLLEREALRHQVEATALLAAGQLAELKLQFMRSVSHELRTPLNGIIGLTAIGLRAHDLDKAHNTFQRIQALTDSLLGMIGNILDFNDVHSNTLAIAAAPFDLAALGRRLIAEWQPRATAKGLQFSATGWPTEAAWRLGDAHHIDAILAQLLSNAIKFTDRGTVACLCRSEDDNVVFSIADSGVGMDDAALVAAFQPFQQADGSLTRRFGGIGLALSLVRLIVERMGGQLGVDSVAGVGSRFEVTLPLPRSTAE